MVDMDILSRIFAEKFRITFKVCVRTYRGEGGQKSLKVCKHLLSMAAIEFRFVLSRFKFDHTTGEYFTDQSVISTWDSFSRTTSVQCVS